MTITKEKKGSLSLPSISIFGKINKEQINHFTPPYAIRNNCQIGQWTVGEDNLLGNELEISIIAMRNFYGSLGKTKGASWLQIWFVAAPSENKIPSNTVCVTYVKTRTLSQLGQKAIEIMETEDPGVGIFKTKFEKHTGEYGNYYSVNWDWRPRTDEEISQLQLIADFLNTNPNLQDTNLPPTMIEVINEPESLLEAQKELKAIEASKTKN